MLLEVRESEGRRYSSLLLPGLAGFVLLVGAIGISVWRSLPSHRETAGNAAYGISKFSITFLNDYWLHFELTSVLLVAAVVAALAVIQVSRRADDSEAPWIGPSCCSAWRSRCSRWGCSA